LIIFIIIGIVFYIEWRVLSAISKPFPVAKKQQKEYIFIEDLEREEDELTEESYNLTGDLL